MTSPNGTSGIEPVTAPGIHDQDWNNTLTSPRTQEQMRGTGEAMVKIILAQVLYAMSGINVLGIHFLDPFGILRSFADDLVNQANDAYNNAANAQSSANTANTGVAALNSTVAAGSDVSFSDTFDRPNVTHLGSDYDQSYDAGSGYLATNGVSAAWYASGGSQRTGMARRVTALTKNAQQCQAIFTGAFVNQNTLDKVSLCLRMNAARDTYVELRIYYGMCEIGVVVSGVYTQLATAAITSNPGDTWQFLAGTAADDYEFIAKQNGTDVFGGPVADSGHVSVLNIATHIYTGFIYRAGLALTFGFTQTSPPEMEIFTGGDRTP